MKREQQIQLMSLVVFCAGLFLSIILTGTNSPLAESTCCFTLIVGLFLFGYGFFTNRRINRFGWWLMRDVAEGIPKGTTVVDHMRNYQELNSDLIDTKEVIGDSLYRGDGGRAGRSRRCPFCNQIVENAGNSRDYYCPTCDSYISES